MAAPGHQPIKNTPSDDETASVPEVLIRPRVRAPEAPPLVPGYRTPSELSDVRRPRVEIDDLEVSIVAAPPLRDAAEGSFGENALLEVVIGVDDRIAVGDDQIRSNPWRQICALRIKAASGEQYVGTAWFIAPSVLATAGHCVYLRNEDGWATSIDVIPSLAGNVEPYGRTTATRFASVAGWRDTGDRDFDYGVIFLDEPDLGLRVGNFAVEAPADADLDNALSRIAGYPFDRDRATRQYYHERPLLRVTPTRVRYDIDTFGGQSGSPIWMQVEGRGAVAIGIHTTGTVTGNSGTRISEPVLDNLITWTEETR